MNPINPYRRNCEVMHRFFSKPIFLILGIVFSLSVLTSFVLSFLNLPAQINLLNILPIIAFFLFYFKGKSSSSPASFNAPINIMKVYSIINIILISLATLVFILFILVYITVQNSSAYTSELISSLIDILFPFICYIATPNAIISLLFFISMLILFNSFKNSTTSIYLYRKGSIFTVVTSILSIICIVATSIVFVLMYANIFNNNKIDLYFASNYLPNINQFDFMDFATVISYIIEIITYVLFIVLGLSYNSYIKKLSTSIGVENRQSYFNTAPIISKNEGNEYSPINMWNSPENNPYQNQYSNTPSPVSMWNDTVPVNIWSEPSNNSAPANLAAPIKAQPLKEPSFPSIPTPTQSPAKPVEFDPQPVFGNNTAENISIDNITTKKHKETDFNISLSDTQLTKQCYVCGKTNPTDCIFCGKCGTKLK